MRASTKNLKYVYIHILLIMVGGDLHGKHDSRHPGKTTQYNETTR